jgi:hypothetical protein
MGCGTSTHRGNGVLEKSSSDDADSAQPVLITEPSETPESEPISGLTQAETPTIRLFYNIFCRQLHIKLISMQQIAAKEYSPAESETVQNLKLAATITDEAANALSYATSLLPPLLRIPIEIAAASTYVVGLTQRTTVEVIANAEKARKIKQAEAIRTLINHISADISLEQLAKNLALPFTQSWYIHINQLTEQQVQNFVDCCIHDLLKLLSEPSYQDSVKNKNYYALVIALSEQTRQTDDQILELAAQGIAIQAVQQAIKNVTESGEAKQQKVKKIQDVIKDALMEISRGRNISQLRIIIESQSSLEKLVAVIQPHFYLKESKRKSRHVSIHTEPNESMGFEDTLETLQKNLEATIRDYSRKLILQLKDLQQPKDCAITGMSKLQSALRAGYRSQPGVELLLHEGKKIPLEEIYVDLELIQRKKKAKQTETAPEPENSVMQSQQLIRREFSGITATDIEERKPITPDKLFEAQEEDPAPKRISIQGSAGTGKTTLCRYLAYKWAIGEIWHNQFDVVIYLPLREFVFCYDKGTEYRKRGIEGILKGNWTSMDLTGAVDDFGKFLIQEREKTALWEHYEKNPEKVLFLLDGYDEVREQHPAVEMLIERASSYILTSRPQAIPEQIERKIENIGFSKKSQYKYIQKYFELIGQPEKATELLEWIKTNSYIQNLSMIAINCQLICAAWQVGKLPKQPTMTQLYSVLMEQWKKRALLRMAETDGRKSVIANYDSKAINTATNEWMQILTELSCHAMQQDNSVIISGKLLKETIEKYIKPPAYDTSLTELEEIEVYETQKKRLVNELLNFGILKQRGLTEKLYEDQYDFVHLTFVEYLAAEHIAPLFAKTDEAAIKEREAILLRYQYRPKFAIVWWFIAGHLAIKYPSSITTFFQDLSSVQQDLSGFSYAMQLIRCLEESQLTAEQIEAGVEGLSVELENNYIEYIREWLKYFVKLSVGRFKESQFIVEIQINKGELFLDAFLDNLGLSLRLSQKIMNSAFWKEMLENLFSLLQDQEEYVKYLTLKTIAKLAERIPETEISALLEKTCPLLQDQGDYVRSLTLEAIAELAERMPEAEISALLEKIFPLLQDQGDYVRSSTLEAIAKLAELMPEAEISALVEKIFPLLQDQEKHVIYSILKAIAKLAELMCVFQPTRSPVPITLGQ